MPWLRDLRFVRLAAALFVVEVLIACFCHDRWLRPYGGDVLSVGLVYALIRALCPVKHAPALAAALAVALAVELAQYGGLVSLLGLEGVPVARTVLGTSFDWADLGAYALGGALVQALRLRVELSATPRLRRQSWP